VAEALRRRDDAVRGALGNMSLRSLATATDVVSTEAWRTATVDRERAA
jgi:hypothetical protein